MSQLHDNLETVTSSLQKPEAHANAGSHSRGMHSQHAEAQQCDTVIQQPN